MFLWKQSGQGLAMHTHMALLTNVSCLVYWILKNPHFLGNISLLEYISTYTVPTSVSFPMCAEVMYDIYDATKVVAWFKVNTSCYTLMNV